MRNLNYRDWAGYHARCITEKHREHRYAIGVPRVCSISPLFQYLVSGPDVLRWWTA
jgi:hypothetical protein